MPSIFPGVEPYLESQGYWPDFHTTFMNYWREAVADALPGNYEARIEENVRLVEAHAKPRLIGPDIALERRGEPGTGAAAVNGRALTATLEPETIPPAAMDLVEERERSIHILRRPGRSLVAVLELLSPANKEEPGYSYYLTKRLAILKQEVHLVELDLLRGGHRPPLAREYPTGDYCAVIARAHERPDTKVYSWTVRRPLPTLPIPLSPPDADIVVDLQEVFTTAFDRARYARSIDYTQPPTAVSKDDADWADQVRQAALTA